ncbi:hypothetical protein NC651_038526 [Populus alba x Populus x berolinensis]|nr:hypothetical protein NC651_038526 [Populus alba x Populus x berolinensis]
MLDHQYKLFKILPNESITSMFARMITITNSLDGLGRTYTTVKIVRKIIKSQQKTWKANVMII